MDILYEGDNKQLHDALKGYLKENGILEQDICDTLGKSRQNLSNIFNRMNHGDDVGLYTLYRLAKGMDCEIHFTFVPKDK